jgi:hypothetical protein
MHDATLGASLRSPKEALVNELTCYYISGELDDLIQGDLRQWIDASARRLVAELGETARKVAELLRCAESDRTSQLASDLERASNYPYTGSDEEWEVFQRISRGMSRSIEEALDRRSSALRSRSADCGQLRGDPPEALS